MVHIKDANPAHDIMDELSHRWSPYGFSDRRVEPETIRSLFEAARWAPSAFNEQPWRYIVATKDDPQQFAKVLACMVESNQAWAKHAYLIGLGVARMKFTRNEKSNRVAFHDLGQASANLTVQAIHCGLRVHQMGGILPDQARELFEIPEQFEAVTGIVVGYTAELESLSDEFRERDTTPRARRPIEQFVFGETWEKTSDIVRSVT